VLVSEILLVFLNAITSLVLDLTLFEKAEGGKNLTDLNARLTYSRLEGLEE
jgi:hypothetical protein